MKTLFLLLALAIHCCAQRQGQNQIGPTLGYEFINSVTAAGLQRGWRGLQHRLVNGVTNNLNDPGWEEIKGTVLQNVPGGMMVNVGYTGERIYVQRAPVTADDLAVSVWAKDTGELYSYNTVGGSSKSIRKFDCGIAVTAAPPVYVERPLRPLSEDEKRARDERVLKYQIEQAEKGLPSFQFIMGKRYQTGNGVPRDVKMAREFFQKSAAQGDTDAKTALKELATN